MIEQAAQAWADEMTRQQVENAERNQPELLKRTLESNPNFIEEFRQKKKAEAMVTIQGLIDRSEAACKEARWGKYHPSNKFSRKLFTAATGKYLPHTVAGTDNVVREWFGYALVAYENARNAEIEAEKASQERARMEREIVRKAAVSKDWLEGKPISGCDLLELARDIGIDLHPRTVGTIRRRLSTVRITGSASIYGKRLPDGVWDVIRQVRDRFNRETVEV